MTARQRTARMFSAHLALLIRKRLTNFVVLPFEYDVVERWASMASALREQLKGKGVNDLWTAACALSHRMPLMTNKSIGLPEDSGGIPDIGVGSSLPMNTRCREADATHTLLGVHLP